jgi:hypothetical protein
VLAGLGVELALGIERAARALQEEIRPFPPRQLALGSAVTSHFSSPAFSAGKSSGFACDFPVVDRTKVGFHFRPAIK